ncbi:MAG: hypothetical protein ACJAZW_001896 [Maritalea sp.]|jgi:hypothetical protein
MHRVQCAVPQAALAGWFLWVWAWALVCEKTAEQTAALYSRESYWTAVTGQADGWMQVTVLGHQTSYTVAQILPRTYSQMALTFL